MPRRAVQRRGNRITATARLSRCLALSDTSALIFFASKINVAAKNKRHSYTHAHVSVFPLTNKQGSTHSPKQHKSTQSRTLPKTHKKQSSTPRSSSSSTHKSNTGIVRKRLLTTSQKRAVGFEAEWTVSGLRYTSRGGLPTGPRY